MKPEEIIYADPNECEFDLKGARMSYFYMHGEAETRTGYDCCNGNLEALRGCMRAGAFIATLEFPDGTQELCIVRSKFSGEGHMSGFVVLLTDIDAIKFAFQKSERFPSMFEHDKDFLENSYPEANEAIKEVVKEYSRKKSRVPKRILTEEEAKSYRHNLTVGGLKKSIEDYGIPDEAKVVIQRIEDVYYDRHGWGVMLKEGEQYHNAIQMNESMKEEISRRERGEEPEYPGIDDPTEYICEDEDFLKNLKDQYHPAWCVAGYKDRDFLFIDLHY